MPSFLALTHEERADVKRRRRKGGKSLGISKFEQTTYQRIDYI